MDGGAARKGKETNDLNEEVSKPANFISPNTTTDRAEEVKTLLCRGLDRTTILQYAAQTGWECAPEDVDRWITAAQLQLAEDAAAIDIEAELGKSIARCNWLYMQATKVQDFRTGLSIQKEINKTLELKIAAARARTPKVEPGKFRLTIAQ